MGGDGGDAIAFDPREDTMRKAAKWLTRKLGAWLDRLSYPILVPLALLLAAAPFFPEPHLFETSRMLVAGELTEPIYIFDFFMHSFGLVLLGAKIGRDLLGGGDSEDDEKNTVATDTGDRSEK